MVKVTSRTGGLEGRLEGTRLVYEDAHSDVLVLSVQGHDGTGKSSLALDAPGPIAYFHTNDGVHRAIARYRREVGKSKKIAFASYEWEKPEFDQAMKKRLTEDAWDAHWVKEAEKIRDGAYEPFINDWYRAIESGDFRTMVQDFATDLWSMFGLAHFGKLQENPQLMWGKVNAAYTDCIKDARKAGLNVVLVHQVGPVYKNVLNPKNGKTKSVIVEGKWKRKGMGQVGYIADSFVETTFTEGQWFNGKRRSDDEFGIRVVKCKDVMELNGEEFPALRFAELAEMLKPGVDPEKWV